MNPFKVALQHCSVLTVLISFQAMAEEAICRNANSAIQQLSDKDRSAANLMMGVRPTFQAKVAEGFLYGNESGMSFTANKIVPWGDGDLLVIHPKESDAQIARGEANPTKFFIQYDEAPYNGPKDKGTSGGIYKVNSKDATGGKNGVECSRNALTYAHHFFPKEDPSTRKEVAPEVGDVYCVRTRSGDNYALIKVTSVCNNGVIFDYKFNGESNFFSAEAEESGRSNQRLSKNSTARIQSAAK